MSAHGFRQLLILTLVTAALACVHPRLGAPDAKWQRVETEHFRVYTDLEPARARAQALELERVFHAFLDHGWVHQGDPPFILNAILFSNPYEVEKYTGPEIAGFLKPSLLFEPWMVLAVPDRVRGLDLLQHELTHYIAHQGIQHQPRWFGEGIAGYFETARFVSDSEFEVGSVPRRLYAELLRSGALPASKLWNPEEGHQRPRFYATAWALVHYLMSEHSEAFVVYQDELARGLSDEAAWKVAFPKLPRESIDGKVREYLLRGQYDKFVRRVPSYPASAKSAPLSGADQHALEGLLLSMCVDCGAASSERAEKAFALALASDPQQVQASAMRTIARVEKNEDVTAEALRVAKQHPQEWVGWAALGLAHAHAGTLSQPGDADPVAHLVRLAPRNPYTWFFSAVQYGGRGERALALRDVARVRRMAPSDVPLLVNSAELLFHLGACNELSDAARSIEAISHVGVSEPVLRSLANWTRRCAPPTAASL